MTTPQPVTDSTVSNAAEGVFVGVEPATPVVQTPTDATSEEAPKKTEERYFTQADLEKVRQSEKNKLYPQIDELKSELLVLKKDREERLEAERLAQEQAEAEAKAKAEEELSAKELLVIKEQEWQDKLEAERRDREQAFALLDKERSFAEISEYRSQRMAEVGDDIVPQLRDLVVGNTKEEIDASIAGLIEKSSAILEEAQAALQASRQQMVGTRVTSPPTTEPDTNMAQQQFTPEDIQNMSMAEYAKYRASLLGNTGGGSTRGMFG